MYLLTGFFNERYRQIDRLFRQAVFLQSFLFSKVAQSLLVREAYINVNIRGNIAVSYNGC